MSFCYGDNAGILLSANCSLSVDAASNLPKMGDLRHASWRQGAGVRFAVNQVPGTAPAAWFVAVRVVPAQLTRAVGYSLTTSTSHTHTHSWIQNQCTHTPPDRRTQSRGNRRARLLCSAASLVDHAALGRGSSCSGRRQARAGQSHATYAMIALLRHVQQATRRIEREEHKAINRVGISH